MVAGPFDTPSGLTYLLRSGTGWDVAPLVVLTRDLGRRSRWDVALSAFRERDAIVAGTGAQAGPAAARAVVELVTQVSDSRVVLVDDSPGGRLGRAVTTMAPRRVAGLFLVDAGGGLATLLADRSDDLATLIADVESVPVRALRPS